MSDTEIDQPDSKEWFLQPPPKIPPLSNEYQPMASYSHSPSRRSLEKIVRIAVSAAFRKKLTHPIVDPPAMYTALDIIYICSIAGSVILTLIVLLAIAIARQ